MLQLLNIKIKNMYDALIQVNYIFILQFNKAIVFLLEISYSWKFCIGYYNVNYSLFCLFISYNLLRMH